MDTLKTRWKIFAGIMLDPWNLLLTVGLVVLFSISSPELSALTSGLIFTLITIASAILGGRVTKRWVDITEGGVVIARGKSAVRSLKLLLRNIAALEARVASFLNNKDEIEKHPEVTKRNYEEIVEICNLLEEETVSSIENWTDIVPEAGIKTQIGIISELKNTLNDKENDLRRLNQQLQDAKGQSEQERIRLKEEIKRKERQISDLTREIMERKAGLGGLGFPTGLEALGPRAGLSQAVGLGLYRPKGLLGSTDLTPGTNVGLGVASAKSKETEEK